MLLRKDIKRQERRDERKEKRQVRAEAKRARKANVRPSAKWTPERKAEMKLEKKANRGPKLEKRNRNLMKRSNNFKIQADKMITQATRAEAQYEQLLKQVKVGLVLPPRLTWWLCDLHFFFADGDVWCTGILRQGKGGESSQQGG